MSTKSPLRKYVLTGSVSVGKTTVIDLLSKQGFATFPEFSRAIINEELKKEISRVLTFELKNSKVTGLVSVTKAKITPDFKYAKVYVSILNSKSIGKTMEGLKESSGFIRSQVAKNINLRITPELIFELDDSLEYGAKIDSILNELKKNN